MQYDQNQTSNLASYIFVVFLLRIFSEGHLIYDMYK